MGGQLNYKDFHDILALSVHSYEMTYHIPEKVEIATYPHFPVHSCTCKDRQTCILGDNLHEASISRHTPPQTQLRQTRLIDLRFLGRSRVEDAPW
jgi:hypothetical protein